MNPTDIFQVLSKCELFVNLSQEEINPIIALCQIENYQPRDTLYHQKKKGTKIYIIKEGQVSLEHSFDLGGRKANLTAANLGPGRVLGAWAVLLDESYYYMTSAICKRKTEILSIEGHHLREVLEKNPSTGFKVMARLASILRDRMGGIYGAMEKL
jgi:cAMP-binding proteins - catabolite gene activator and regulatory subunit of cAMP-dependent protein kinases